MPTTFSVSVQFDLLKVGHCGHPECVALQGGGRRAIDFPALVGLIEHPRHGLILYDTGYSKHFDEATRKFPECLYAMITPVTLPPEEELLTQLESRGIAPSDIGTILISHFHADHVAGLKDFPKARFLATGKEFHQCRKMGRLRRLKRAFLRDLLPPDFEERLQLAEETPKIRLSPRWEPFTSAMDLFEDTSLLGFDLPGHTASQLGVAFRTTEGTEFFLVGDACWKKEGLEQDRRPSRLAYGLFADSKEYDNTFTQLKNLLESASQPIIVPSHCDTTWRKLGGTRRISRA